MKSKNLIMIVALGALCATHFSCSKNINDIYISTGGDCDNNGGSNNGGGGTSGGDGTNANKGFVQFTAGIESQKTKGVYAFPKSRYATIMAYTAGTVPAVAPLSSMPYIANSPGTLTSVSGIPMYLPNGSYDFYSVATNQKSNSNPAFTSGASEPLKNGIDYLYWNAKAQTVVPPQLSVPITYEHECTQIVVKLVSGKGITIDSLSAATITPSAPGATMSLATGVITPATSLSSAPVAMGVSALVAQYTMLPVNSTTQAKATFTIFINGETASRNYQVSFALPSTGWTAGNSYVYQATVDANEIIFNSVNVRDWIPVDETNTPLYPTQI
ncbi:MAG: fimbrillin family protein [Bacteroidales bacterium]